VTPFDAIALRVMLETFYPIVTPSALRRARSERPDYFAGGVLFGTKGDKLRLADGREFDCIAGTSGPHPTWWVGLIEPGEGGGENPFPLEEGPLTPLDLETFRVPRAAPEFEALAIVHAAELGDADRQAETARGDVGSPDVLAALSGSIGEAADATWRAGDTLARELETVDPLGLLEETSGTGGQVESVTGEWDSDEPPPDPSLPETTTPEGSEPTNPEPTEE